jgi:hypothetical protein
MPPIPVPAAPRWPARVLIGLFALQAVLAWLALQAVFVFVELTWRLAAGVPVRPLLASHLRQLDGLRWIQAALWLITAAMLARWLHTLPSRPARAWWSRYSPPGARAVRWAGALLLAAVTADGAARGLALWSGGPLDLGPATAALVLAQVLAIAAAGLGIRVLATNGSVHADR